MNISALEALKETSGRPLLCLEVNPPRGVDVEGVLSRFASLKGVDLVNITDSALAKMRCSGLVFAALFKQRFGIEPLVNLSCRDRNVIGMQSELLGAWSMGVRSVVALTGDAVTVGDLPDAKGVFEVNSIGLLKIIAALNGGKDLSGFELKGAPQFLPGVVVNPNVKNHNAELKRLAKKKESGAVYALSQPVFDAEQAVEFFKAAADIGVNLFVGLLPFKSVRSFEMIANVPGIKTPDSAVARIRKLEEAAVAEESFQIALEVAQATRPFVRGFHVVSGGSPLLAIQLCNRLVSWLDSI
jgi:5,10-methylenetetrahydrofolate reductase